MINKNILEKELESVLEFWLKNVVLSKSNDICFELSNKGYHNSEALKGSMYLGRIVYGASVGCKTLKTNKYKLLADIAFQKLITDLKNPKGGYYWAKDYQGNVVHDADNVNMAQAFVLYGLAEYASLSNDVKVIEAMEEQSDFIIQRLTDKENGGYLDGFNAEWELGDLNTKALGTHIHLLEAFTKQYQFSNDAELVPIIEDLINLIVAKLFLNDNAEFLHRTTPDWHVLANENWAGHNAEVSWILCQSAAAIKNDALIKQTKHLALQIMDKVIDVAIDKENGGVFNVIDNDKPIETVKGWWPQAEVAIGLMNAYQISNDKKYRDFATNFINYISQYFFHESGEWYTQIYNDNKPVQEQPLIFFWKSMYHNVRYYVEMLNRIN